MYYLKISLYTISSQKKHKKINAECSTKQLDILKMKLKK